MWVLYFIAVSAYGRAIGIASRFNAKAKAWISGRKNWQKNLKAKLANDTRKRIWFHCASLGEFEQGRPVIEAVKKEFPDHLILLTFFSPSGYEVKKNDPIADIVCYMPLDGPVRSKKFILTVNPTMVFFVKYEFWYFYGKELSDRKIPYFCVSAIFRPEQVYFHSMGAFFRKMLTRHTQIFVQDQESLQLLYKARITNVTVSGDTRFDRVYDTAQHAVEMPEIASFCKDSRVMVCGSTWSDDEDVLLPLINAAEPGMKFILAPHEIGSSRIQKLKSSVSRNVILFSELKLEPTTDADVLIIDNVGMLSRIYQYAELAYIGGGFGVGIHNILEAVVFGLPVIIGPNYEKFREARDLISRNAVFSIHNKEELQKTYNRLVESENLRSTIAATNKKYIDEKRGATQTIMGYLSVNYG